MTSSQPTQPPTDAELAQIREEHSGPYDGHVQRLLAEVSRLRAENTAQAKQVAIARAELQRCMGRLEPYAQQLKAAGNIDAGVPIRVAVGVLRLAEERIDEADPSALGLDQDKGDNE